MAPGASLAHSRVGRPADTGHLGQLGRDVLQHRRLQRVDDAAAATLRANQTSTLQHLEMARDRWPRHLKLRCQLPGRCLALSQQTQNLAPRWIPKSSICMSGRHDLRYLAHLFTRSQVRYLCDVISGIDPHDRLPTHSTRPIRRPASPPRVADPALSVIAAALGRPPSRSSPARRFLVRRGRGL